MSPLELLALAIAGFGAGMINTIVGSGTLITFPILLFFGYAPVAANISSSLGLVAGGFSGAWGYRHELTGLKPLLMRLMPASLLGAVVGALLLLVLPESAFATIVPLLIALALVLVVGGPRLNKWAAGKTSKQTEIATGLPSMTLAGTAGLLISIFATGVYGGYFGAAQGVLLVGIMSVLLPLSLQQITGVKNMLTLTVGLVAAVVFLLVQPGQIIWSVVGILAVGSLAGGYVGAKVGRRMPPWLLRGVIVAIGLTAMVVLLR
ncbi:sulfite exporter TauE/SafE family protein [Ornithinimicrobium sp. Arc0846-15]|nr:sulfite exporter TauE/SafE family protein [Ornithinimicrobium laminariae]